MGEGMVKRIGGQISTSFCLDMSGLSAHAIVRIQLTCGSEMALIGPGGVTLSVSIQTRTLWYGGNFLFLFKFHTVMYIR
jgi:hypothetical protein